MPNRRDRARNEKWETTETWAKPVGGAPSPTYTPEMEGRCSVLIWLGPLGLAGIVVALLYYCIIESDGSAATGRRLDSRRAGVGVTEKDRPTLEAVAEKGTVPFQPVRTPGVLRFDGDSPLFCHSLLVLLYLGLEPP